MLNELHVLVLKVLTGSLQTIDFLNLVLLLGESLTNDLACLGVGLVLDALGILTSLANDVVGSLLGSDKSGRDLTLASGVIGCNRSRSRRGR